MLAVARFRVLTASVRTAQDGKAWVDVYLLQDGRREPVVAYADPAALNGTLPEAGDLIDAAVLVYARRGEGISTRIDAFASAQAGTPVGSALASVSVSA